MLRPLDVIWVDDDLIRPPGPKMWVCIEPALGLFFRINTDPKWQTPVRLEKAAHPFLDHDSHLECGEPLDADDFLIEESLRRRGVIGQIIPQLAAAIFETVSVARTVSESDKAAIGRALGLSK